MDYIERIKTRKSEKKITNDQLSELTGIPVSTLSKILAGFSDSPKLSNIVAICDALDCSLDYIVSGVPENTNNYTLEPDEMLLVEDYRKLDRHGREMIRLVLDKENERLSLEAYETVTRPTFDRPIITKKGMAAGYGARNNKEASGLAKRKIPLYDLPVSAGIGEYLDDEMTDEMTEEISIPANEKTADADYALRISGNSMEPKYHDGDLILVENCDAVEEGEAAIYILDGSSYFKVYGGDRLISLNPEYADILLKDFSDIRCGGRVIGKLKRK